MDKKFLKYIGHDLYNVKKLKERKRYIVFRIRCGLHKSQSGHYRGTGICGNPLCSPHGAADSGKAGLHL